MTKETIEKIKELKILKVADRLKISYSKCGTWRMACCWMHNDHSPSLGLNVASNSWRCFVCKRSGGLIDLVMEHEQLNFNDACRWLIDEFNIIETETTYKPTVMSTTTQKETGEPIKPSWKNETGESSFTRALVNNHMLNPEQMAHAIERFRLASLNDRVIFWQIDLDGEIREGKVMAYEADAHRSHNINPLSYSWLLKQQGKLPKDWKAKYCLFGLHQLRPYLTADAPESPIVAIVESEKTAIICSELLPYHISGTWNRPIVWMATGGKSNLTVEMLRPLFPASSPANERHSAACSVILFPDTDATGETYAEWLKEAKDISKQFGLPIAVSDLLERHASQEQKERKIDIADYLLAPPCLPQGEGI